MTQRPLDDRLIVALDFATTMEARDMVARLEDQCQFYKIGLELLFAGGQELSTILKAEGKQVFIDAKLLDIGATVEKATANIARLGGDFLTLHITDQKTMEAAVRGRASSQLKLLGVSVMTNLDKHDLEQQGISGVSPQELVLKRAKMAAEAGFDGVIASAKEAAAIRTLVGPDFLIVTPGIRPLGSDHQDQTRVLTPFQAIEAGADHIVVGRPITRADDPLAAATAIRSEIAAAVTDL